MTLSQVLLPDTETTWKIYVWRMLAELKKTFSQNCAKERAIHLNISVAVKRHGLERERERIWHR